MNESKKQKIDDDKDAFLLHIAEIRHPKSFVKLLKHGIFPINYFLEKTDGIKELIKDYDDKKYDDSIEFPDEFFEKLIDEFNTLISGPLLFDEKVFASIYLSDKVRRLISKKPEGIELLQLNRILLEHIFPYEISRVDDSYSVENKEDEPTFSRYYEPALLITFFSTISYLFGYCYYRSFFEELSFPPIDLPSSLYFLKSVDVFIVILSCFIIYMIFKLPNLIDYDIFEKHKWVPPSVLIFLILSLFVAWFFEKYDFKSLNVEILIVIYILTLYSMNIFSRFYKLSTLKIVVGLISSLVLVFLSFKFRNQYTLFLATVLLYIFLLYAAGKSIEFVFTTSSEKYTSVANFVVIFIFFLYYVSAEFYTKLFMLYIIFSLGIIALVVISYTNYMQIKLQYYLYIYKRFNKSYKFILASILLLFFCFLASSLGSWDAGNLINGVGSNVLISQVSLLDENSTELQNETLILITQHEDVYYFVEKNKGVNGFAKLHVIPTSQIKSLNIRAEQMSFLSWISQLFG